MRGAKPGNHLNYAYDSDFWFSLGHKRFYDSPYDSDSIASENQS